MPYESFPVKDREEKMHQLVPKQINMLMNEDVYEKLMRNKKKLVFTRDLP